MSTNPSPLGTAIAKDWSWFLSHLTAIAMVAGLLVGGVYFVENLEAKHDAKQTALYSTLAAQSAAQVSTLTSELKQNEENWANVQAQLLSQNEKLAEDVAAKNQQLSVQVKTDATLNAQDAADRLAQQTQAAPGEVRAQEDTVNLSLPVTRRIVSDLDTLPVLQSNLTSTQTQLSNETTIAANAQSDSASKQKIIDAQVTQIANNEKACNAQISLVKSQARKSQIKAFFAGAAAVAVAILGHAL